MKDKMHTYRWFAPVALSVLLLAGCSASNSTATSNGGSVAKASASAKAKGNAGQFAAGSVARNGALAITLVAVTDPYTSPNQFTQPQAGNRDVAITVSMQGVGSHQALANPGQFSVKTGDNHIYNQAIVVTDHTLQLVNLSKGEISDGMVVFEIPDGATVSQLKYDGGFGNDDIAWTAQ